MRCRLIFTYLALLALVLLALEVPLASYIAAERTEKVVVDRLLDATRIAATAEPALRQGAIATLAVELDRYHELYGISAAVVDRNAEVVVASGDRGRFAAKDTMARLSQALAGDHSGGDGPVRPWNTGPLVTAVPVTSGGETIGAVATLSPTGRLRAGILRAWLLEAGIGGLALALFVVVAVALARWILRPVGELEATALAMTAGDLDSRVPESAGPPEVRRLARSFNAMAASLADALGRQRAFVSQASHQLRNPLTALRIRVENLAQYASGDGAREHSLALEETDRLGKILEGLLALARAERERQPMIEVDAAAVVAERIAAWQPLAAKLGIDLRRSDLPESGLPEPVLVRAVATGVDQALDALIDNALKFVGAGGVVTVGVERKHFYVDVRVIDDGPGMTPAECVLAVQKLWRAPMAQCVDGAGLGWPSAAALRGAWGAVLLLRPSSPRGRDAILRFPTGGRSDSTATESPAMAGDSLAATGDCRAVLARGTKQRGHS